MLVKTVNGKSPVIPEDCYVAENATIIGKLLSEILVVFGLMPLFVAM